MSGPRLCKSSNERGSCRSLWPTHGRPHASAQDHEDWLLLVDYGDRLLLVSTEMSRVSNARRLDTRATF